MRDGEMTPSVAHARALLEQVQARTFSADELAQQAVRVAAELLREAEKQATDEEQDRAKLLSRLMDDPDGQVFTTSLTDRIYRSETPSRIVEQTSHLIDELGPPRYLSPVDRLQLRAVSSLGSVAPNLLASALLRRLRHDTDDVILPADRDRLAEHLARRRAEGVRVNLNQLGEAVLGEEEADQRVHEYVELLSRPDVETISVKVSSICCQLNLLAFDDTLRRLRERLRPIYAAALEHPLRRDGLEQPKLVNLDMEAYRDLHLTYELFTGLLDEPAFRSLTAGIVLQAYLPDSVAMQRELTAWARQRVENGGAPVRLRIVKGANLALEQVEASLRNWPVPVYPSKHDVDANFKRMVAYGCQREHARAVQLGIASHNVFDLAYGMVLRAHHGVQRYVEFEMLEGMADNLRRAVQAVADDVLLYGPIVDEEQFHTAIAYLMRRLDENTATDNFLRHSFAMEVGDEEWEDQRERFLRACSDQEQVSSEPRRVQDRRLPPERIDADAAFDNEPDTDFSLAHNRAWIEQTMARLHDTPSFDLEIPGASGPLAPGFDPSRPDYTPYSHRLYTEADIERALTTAVSGQRPWAERSADERDAILGEVAHALRCARGELIAAMVLDGGKEVTQADSEVSEAIDFTEYYRRCYRELRAQGDVQLTPRGVVVVTPPWNFPLAIPVSGSMASLVAGNAVILKPSLETVYVAHKLCELAWGAGVPRDALQLVVCEDEVGSRLIRDERVSAVALTGAADTARLFLSMRPHLELMAETGGKNSLVVSAVADRDLMIHDIVYSAFAHAGQKCSAASLLVCEAEVYDDPRFLQQLADAARSLPVGSAWDLENVVTPLIRPPGEALERGLTTLDEGESWLLEPRPVADNPRLYTPGIKLGVQQGSFAHQTELFGPVLAVMRARDLDHAIELANDTPYGLTAGIHSLDEREQQQWCARMLAGNLYVNRVITGSIVRRQPFGGLKDSSFGPGAKAGGPNYVGQFARVRERALPSRLDKPLERAQKLLDAVGTPPDELVISAQSYAHWWETHFSYHHDPSHLLGQDNLFGYLRCRSLAVLACEDASEEQILRACVAALTCGCDFELWVPEGRAVPDAVTRSRTLHVRREPQRDLERLLREGQLERLRAVGTPPEVMVHAAARGGVHLATGPVLANGRFELLHYLREQSISVNYHRYGNLGRGRFELGPYP